MELQQLKYFVAAAETRNFTRAAASLFITQPTLSRQVQVLERELGVKLFERGPRRVVLTTAGAKLLPVAQAALEQLNLLKSLAGQLGEDGAGGSRHLSVGLSATYLAHYSGLVSGFRARCPDVELEVVEDVSVNVLQMVRRGVLDLAVGVTDEVDDLSFEPLVEVVLGAFLPADHPLAAQERVDLRQLDGRRLIVMRRGNPATDLFFRTCAAHKITPSIAAEGTTTPESMLKLVEAGLGIGVFARHLHWQRPSITILPLTVDGEAVRSTGAIFWHPKRELSRAARELIEAAREATRASSIA